MAEDNAMKILMMARNLVSDISAPKYVLELSREYIKLGHEVIIPTSNQKENVDNAKIKKLPKFFSHRMLAPIFYSSFAKIAKFNDQAEVIHGNGYTLYDDVTTVHFMNISYRNRLKQYNIEKKSSIGLVEFLQKSILKSSKHLIAVSEIVKNDLVELYGIKKEKITTIHNGVNLQEFAPSNVSEKRKLLSEYGLDQNKKILLFVGGSAHERKGFKFLLKALPELSDEVLVLAVCRNLSDKYSEYFTRSKNYVKN